MDDAKLIEQAKADPEAFGALYDYYYEPILNYILRRTGDVSLAQDLTSNTFFKAMRKMETFRQDVSFSAWLYKIASNEVIDYYRSKKRLSISLDFLAEKNGFELESDTNLEQEILEAEETLSRHNQYRIMLEAFQTLPIKYQEIIALRYFEKKKISEINEITGMKINTIKSLLKRGKFILQKKTMEHGRKMPPFLNPIVIKSERGKS